MTSTIDRINDRGDVDEIFTELRRETDSHDVSWVEVHVPDESELSSTRDLMQLQIANANQYLLDHPQSSAPEYDKDSGELITKNPVSDWVYRAPAMRQWRSHLVPTAKALYPIQRPDDPMLPGGFAIDAESKSFYTDAIDSIGIRTRAKIMEQLMATNVSTEQGDAKWISLACGAAVPVLNALRTVGSARQLELQLIDLDEDALKFACELADKEGLVFDEDYVVLQRNLIKDLVLSDRLIDEQGEESANAVDALGIFEYFKDDIAVRFLQQAYRLVKPGGCIVIANMLDTHPQLEFNQRGIGWPTIYPRSRDEIVEIIKAAGIDTANVTGYVAQDGVYGVLSIGKP